MSDEKNCVGFLQFFFCYGFILIEVTKLIKDETLIHAVHKENTSPSNNYLQSTFNIYITHEQSLTQSKKHISIYSYLTEGEA